MSGVPGAAHVAHYSAMLAHSLPRSVWGAPVYARFHTLPGTFDIYW